MAAVMLVRHFAKFRPVARPSDKRCPGMSVTQSPINFLPNVACQEELSINAK